ncbi:hypothetical protein EW026_g605 [Hermanssonia centrifuga]|uniref:Uncharacterized protein n=1 Tax=Hermanssonia centrifuga TaxID=98765 RepID=A0A4S4KU63_9APHY|nr:hypothetical protein EW026_g605 [Hermanssonia centrifuga]
MSDLDADLYGDLYGNDDPEFALPTEQPEAPPKTSSTPPKPEPSASPVDNISQQIPTSNGMGSPTYGMGQTQQIPTYQDRETPEYREVPQPAAGAGYQGAINRPVRPSEMKEEGKELNASLTGWDSFGC